MFWQSNYLKISIVLITHSIIYFDIVRLVSTMLNFKSSYLQLFIIMDTIMFYIL